MRYIPHTEEDVRQMLAGIGVNTVDDLFSEVPSDLRLKRDLDLPEALSETELLRNLKELASVNATAESHLSFLGGGAYNHFIPSVVDQLLQPALVRILFVFFHYLCSKVLVKSRSQIQATYRLVTFRTTPLPIFTMDNSVKLALIVWVSTLR